MAVSDNFSFILNGFEGNAKIYWQELQTEKDFYDVTLACDDKQIKTHKLILSSFSPILKNILKLNQSPHPVIYLRRVKFQNLQNLLDFMYQGETNVAKKDLTNFLELAEDLNVRGLCERNQDVGDFKIEESFQFAKNKQNINLYLKDEMTSKTENINNINQFDFVSENIKFENATDNFFNNYDDKPTLFDQNKMITNKRSNKKCTEDDKKSTISTTEGSYLCDQCDFKTKLKHALKPHIESNHEGKHYSCDQCDYKSKYKQTIQRHVESIHEGLRYPCNQCNYIAPRKDSLRDHQNRKKKCGGRDNFFGRNVK